MYPSFGPLLFEKGRYMKTRKKIYYMDLSAVEKGQNLTHLEQLARERLQTCRDWERLIFWMDIELAMEALSDYEAHCFVLNLIEGYTKEEIALRLKVSRQAVLKQVKKARKKIRKFLEEGYETP